MRHGMFPRFPIYIFSVARERLAGRLQGAQLRSVPIENTALQMENLVRIDVQALAVSREKHHRYLASDSATRGGLLYAGDDCVGYVYVSPDGHIGPLAVARPDALGAAFGTSLSLAVGGSSAQVSAFIPDTSESALGIAVEHGMRITIPMVLMSTHDCGDWARYLPRNPGFM
jgi:hypothetical protein